MAFTGALEDRIALRELLDAYSDAVCRGDANDWAATWADDAVWDLNGQQVHGKDAIVTLWKQAMGAFDAVAFFTEAASFTVEGDRASGRAFTMETLKIKGGGLRRVNGAYADTFVKRGGRWLFASRRFSVLIDDAGA
ncbi:MAG: DUF4440 domain-containing protein [Alphaproteobacteria bacterium]|nr:DUF4440 domain-containing protein [Alphaproteobacteria bacterium]